MLLNASNHYTNLIGLVYVSTMGQKNRKAFMAAFERSNHERCQPTLMNTDNVKASILHHIQC